MELNLMKYLDIVNKVKKALKVFKILLPTNCFSVFDHFVGFAHKMLSRTFQSVSVPVNPFPSHAFQKVVLI